MVALLETCIEENASDRPGDAQILADRLEAILFVPTAVPEKPETEQHRRRDLETNDGGVAAPKSFWELLLSQLQNSPLENLRKEVRAVPESPDELVTFFSKHIGGVSDWLTGNLHSQACVASLTKLRAISISDPRQVGVVTELQRQLDIIQQGKSRKKLWIGAGCAALGIFLLLFALIFGEKLHSHDVSVRQDIQKLIRDGKYDEARIRAHDLDGSNNVEQMMEAIDKAEKNSKSR